MQDQMLLKLKLPILINILSLPTKIAKNKSIPTNIKIFSISTSIRALTFPINTNKEQNKGQQNHNKNPNK